MSRLCCVVYVSTAYKVPTTSDLDHMLESAREFNNRVGVTGVLLHQDGSFFQYLEGECGENAGVNEVYSRIKASKLHYGVTELYRGHIGRRLFGDWLMASMHASEQAMTELRLANWQHLKHETADMSATQSAGLLLLQHQCQQLKAGMRNYSSCM